MSQAKQPKVWILVADGERARVMTPDAVEGRFVTVQPLGAAEHPHYPPDLRQEPHQLDKAHYATRLAQHLSHAADQSRYDQLVLVAPGHVLHAVREALTKPAAARVVGTVPKDYTKLPDAEVYDLLATWWLPPPTQAVA